jgi:sec-independent protein translocase protein TatA
MPIGFHPFELIIILVVALLIFGPKRLPEMGSSIGKGIKEFKKGMSELTSPSEDEDVKLALRLSSAKSLRRRLPPPPSIVNSLRRGLPLVKLHNPK